VIKMMEQSEYPFAELITRVYPFAEAPQALQDWDASPAAYTKILIDLTG
jgi:threonine dehydrogenase-like Zn-dependent dehydrogenase